MADQEVKTSKTVRSIFSRKRSTSEPNVRKDAGAKRDDLEARKQNNGTMGRDGVGSGSRTPPVERRHKLSSLGRLFKPWKWKRKKKSDKFAETQRSLERKISVRAAREDLVNKGILMPETPTNPSGPIGDAPDLLKERDHLNGAVSSSPPAHHAPPYSPLGGAAAASAGAAAAGPPPPRPERPERPASLTASVALPPHPELGLQPSLSEQGLRLAELPEPPISVSEIGPIPPPPMFSNGGGPEERTAPPRPPTPPAPPFDPSADDCDEMDEEEVVCGDYDDDDDEYYPMVPAHQAADEVPAREPRLDLKPLKSALKKARPPPAASPAAGHSPARPLAARQESLSLRFGGGSSSENKENRPSAAAEDSDDSDGPIPYRDDDEAGGDDGVLTRLGSRVQRTDSLAVKLALRPGRQELIDRNILQLQTEQDRTDWRSELSAKLNRRLSLRPTAEELEERNILKTMSLEESIRDMENRKVTLLRKLSFRPTVEELKQRKVIHFNDYVEVTQAHEYDRRADKPWTRLTPRDKAMIRKELNDFKSAEMDVHQESRHLTRFHRP